jgi:5-methyltetrahydropteroyltriglutamate--homocysteine methyltransferase
VRFREKFQDALSVVVSEEERAGLDIVTHGDFHCDEDLAGRSWAHYPMQRLAGYSGDHLQSAETRSEWTKYSPGTLLYEIYTGWRCAGRRSDHLSTTGLPETLANRPVKNGQATSELAAHRSWIVPDIHTPHYKDKRKSVDMAEAMNRELLALRDAGCRCIQVEEPCLYFLANTLGKDHSDVRFSIATTAKSKA